MSGIAALTLFRPGATGDEYEFMPVLDELLCKSREQWDAIRWNVRLCDEYLHRLPSLKVTR
jgi:hypothetical protein